MADDQIIRQLLAGASACGGIVPPAPRRLPSAKDISACLVHVRHLLFPRLAVGIAPAADASAILEEALAALRITLASQIEIALALTGGGASSAVDGSAGAARVVVDMLVEALPGLQRRMALDLQAALAGDPAATSLEEILLCYPGVDAILVHRVAHALWRADVPLIPRLMAEIAHAKTGIDIHPGAVIGDAFFIDHGTGVVIGETTVIGRDVRLYQGVTLGALSVSSSLARGEAAGGGRPRGPKRHPTLGDNVVVYAGATILGGGTVIGDGATIGGNAWVTASVAAGATVVGAHGGRSQ